jgi:hypothetical protein
VEAALEAARARAKELQAQHADEERLGEREAQLEAFAAAVREGLDALDFEGRQRLVRLEHRSGGPVSGPPRPLCTLAPPQQGPHPSYARSLGREPYSAA